MSIELKIKAVSLEQEAKYIRKHERRFMNFARLVEAEHLALPKDKGEVVVTTRPQEARANYTRLHNHRKVQVRREARATHLARAALKGMPYRRVEEKSHDEPPYLRVHQLLRKYSPYGDSWSVDRVRDWFASEEGARLAA